MTDVGTRGVAEHCPSCRAPLVGGGNFVSWCRDCGYNVALTEALAPGRRPSQRRKARATRSAERLYRRLSDADVSRPETDWRRIVSYLIALVVHASSFALAVLGALVLVRGLPNVFLAAVGLVLLVIGIAMRPRMGRLPKDAVRLTRDGAPQTWRLVDEVSRAVGVRAPQVVLADIDLNAWAGAIGLRRRQVVMLGLGLHALLTPQELVGVLAHEVAHSRNGDLRHGLVVGSAMRTLSEWAQALHGDRPVEGDSFAVLADLLGRVLMGVLRVVPLGLLAVLDRLQLRSGQRAEYLADRLGAEVAGSIAMAEALKALLLTDAAYAAMQRAVVRDDPRVWEAPADLRASLPATELERRTRAAREAEHSIDATHPPTLWRVDLLSARPFVPAEVVLGDVWAAAIDSELASTRDALTPQLREELLDMA